MFDVPVFEVTVSSAPALISGIGQANQTTLPKSPFSSALLNAWPVLLSNKDASLPTVWSIPTNKFQSQELFLNGSFQLLQPLNLADATRSLKQVFEQSLEKIPAESKISNQFPTAKTTTTASPTPQVSDIKTEVADQTSNHIALEPAIAKPKKPLPIMPSHALRQCIDTPYKAKPENITALKVFLRGNLIGEVSTLDGTAAAIHSLQNLLGNEPIDSNDVMPVSENGQPAIRLSSDVIVYILPQETNSEADVVDDKTILDKEWAAIVWSDQLRQKMGATPLDAGDIQVMLASLKPSEQTLNGIASWYGPYFHGRQTANGETFDQNTLTAAHKTLPFNTMLHVRNLNNHRTVVVRINDRGPYIGQRSLDLSKAAAQCLGSETIGIIPYEAVILEQTTSE